MLPDSLLNYIHDACPELSSHQKQQLLEEFLKMIRGWARIPEDQQRSFVQKAVAQIRDRFAHSPRIQTVRQDTMTVLVKVSKRSRSMDEVRKLAESHANAWSAKVASIESDVMDVRASVEAVEEYPGESKDFYRVRAKLHGKNISERLVRSAYGKLKRENRGLASAGVQYSQT